MCSGFQLKEQCCFRIRLVFFRGLSNVRLCHSTRIWLPWWTDQQSPCHTHSLHWSPLKSLEGNSWSFQCAVIERCFEAALWMSCLQTRGISLKSWSHVKLLLASSVLISGRRSNQSCQSFYVISGLSPKAARPEALKDMSTYKSTLWSVSLTETYCIAELFASSGAPLPSCHEFNRMQLIKLQQKRSGWMLSKSHLTCYCVLLILPVDLFLPWK